MVAVVRMRCGLGLRLGCTGAAATARGCIGFFVPRVVGAHAMIRKLKPTSRSSMSLYRIGEAARLCGVTAANIRYYEREGLVRPSGRED
ncbi:MAG: MerR family DNA-binding transcriptional regulator, partial [Comamonas sp.]